MSTRTLSIHHSRRRAGSGERTRRPRRPHRRRSVRRRRSEPGLQHPREIVGAAPRAGGDRPQRPQIVGRERRAPPASRPTASQRRSHDVLLVIAEVGAARHAPLPSRGRKPRLGGRRASKRTPVVNERESTTVQSMRRRESGNSGRRRRCSREHHQAKLVDQSGVEQRVDQGVVAGDEDGGRPPLERLDAVDDRPGEHRGVVLRRVGERRRHDDLGHRVHAVGERALDVGHAPAKLS